MIKKENRKRKIWLVVLLCVLFPLLCSCTGEPAQEVATVSKSRELFYGDDNGERLSNPLMGWSYYGFPDEIAKYGIPDEFDVGIILCSWDAIEKTQGDFDLDLLTKAIDRLRNDGKTVYLRLYLMPDNVWGIDGYPAWAKGIPGVGAFKETKLDTNDGPYTFYAPPYESAVYQGLMEIFLRRLCAEYGDGVVDVIDLRAYGLYGEWDSAWGNYWNQGTDPDYKEKKSAALNAIVDLYGRAFETYELTKIAINVSSKQFYDEEQFLAYEKEAAYDNAMRRGFALRFDAVENVYYQDTFFFEWLRQKNYPAAPVFSESVWGTDETKTNFEASFVSFCSARANIATFGFFRNNYEKMYKLDYDFFTETMAPSERFDGRTLGYRIRPTEISFNKEANINGKIEFRSTWVNTGCGTLYRDYPLCLSLTDADGNEVYTAFRDDDFDLTGLVKESAPYTYDTVFNLPDGDVLPAGTYTVRIALVDKNNNHKSAIAMPLGENADAVRDYEIGKITLK